MTDKVAGADTDHGECAVASSTTLAPKRARRRTSESASTIFSLSPGRGPG
jgi:hypothetical protein